MNVLSAVERANVDEHIWADIQHSCEVFAPVVIFLVAIIICSTVQNHLEKRREG